MKVLKLQELSDSKQIYSGVYMIVFPNNKKYIGISNNIRRRMYEHNTDFRKDLPIARAIQKYGKVNDFIVLEEILPENRNLMREREKFWIAKYHSNTKNLGYNISEGGDGADLGSNNHQAKFTEEQIQLIYKELKEYKKTMTEIAKDYDIDLSGLSYINNGKTYFHSSEIYPIRDGSKKLKKGIDNCNSKFDEKMVDKIFLLLKENVLTMKEIAKMFNVVESTIHNINNGTTYIRENESYPLRHSKIGTRKLSNEQVMLVIQELKESSESMNKMGERLGISPKTISGINCGTIYRQKDENYPIRKKQ